MDYFQPAVLLCLLEALYIMQEYAPMLHYHAQIYAGIIHQALYQVETMY